MFDRIRAYPMVVLLLPLVAAILLINQLHPLFPSSDAEPQKYGFVIESAPKPTAQCERFETRVLTGEKGIATHVYLYLLRDSTRVLPTYRDTVVAHTKIEWQRTTGRAFAAKYLVLSAQTHQEPLQVRLYHRLTEAGLEGDELATVGALTLGYKDDIDPEVKRHFQASGAAHVLAVSGLHTGIIYTLLIGLLTLGGRIRPRHENRFGRWIISLNIIAAMWGYAWLTGMTPSVVRAVLMVTLVEIGHMAYKQSVTLNTIASAAVFILLVRPTDLWSVSFQLSFAATAAIVLLARDVENHWELMKLKHTSWGWIPAWILGTIIISLAAQLGTMPITMYCFHQVSTYFLLTNLIVLPIASFLVPCGLITIALGGSLFGVWMGKVTWALAWAMNHSTAWIESLPGSTVSAHVNGGMVLLYYVFLLLFWAFLTKKSI